MKKSYVNKRIIAGLLIMELIYVFQLMYTRSFFLQGYMVKNMTNTGMDFFNMLALMGESDVYCKSSNYPAMVFLILKFFYHLIPMDIVLSDKGIDGFFLRDYLPSALSYMIYSILVIIAIYELIKYIYKENQFESTMLAVAIILSGPIMFTLERGNIILLAFLFSLIYVAFYKSSNRYLRLVAYIALAIAAAIKIYPALLGFLTLSQKKYKETILLIILGIIFFITPFFMFGGLESIYKMLMGLAESANIQGYGGCGYNFSISNLIKIMNVLFGVNISQRGITIFKLLALIYCGVLYVLAQQEWKKFLAVILLMIWLSEFSYTYTLIFMIIPFLLLLKQREEKKQIICLICFMLILIPYSLPVLESMDVEGAWLPLNVSTIIINFSIIILAVVALVDSIWSRYFYKINIEK